MKILRKIKQKVLKNKEIRKYKRRAKKLHIKYVDGLKIGKNVINLGCTIFVDEGVWIGENSRFWGNGEVHIGENTHIGENSWIFSSKNGGVVFGKDVNCAANLYLIDSDHSFNKNDLIRKQPLVSKSIKISDDVWIAANVTILKGTEIGSHTVVGACSLCNKKYQDNVVIGGIPAKVIKEI